MHLFVMLCCDPFFYFSCTISQAWQDKGFVFVAAILIQV